MNHPKEFLGRGWAFPFRFDRATGAVAWSEYEENIRQSVSVILGTRPGERQMLPDFGCRIHELLFAPNTRATAAMVAHYVREALARWEPRIEVTSVEAVPGPHGTIDVEVEYKVVATGATYALSQQVSPNG